MENDINIRELVKGLQENQKFDIIRNYNEKELHWEIKELLQNMYPDSYVEVTHGNTELGKDLVVLSNDALGDRLTGIIVKVGDIKGKTAGIIKEIDWQYGKFLNASFSLEELKKHVNDKWYVNMTISKRKEPGRYWDTHSAMLNEYKKEIKEVKQEDDIDLNDIPF